MSRGIRQSNYDAFNNLFRHQKEIIPWIWTMLPLYSVGLPPSPKWKKLVGLSCCGRDERARVSFAVLNIWSCKQRLQFLTKVDITMPSWSICSIFSRTASRYSDHVRPCKLLCSCNWEKDSSAPKMWNLQPHIYKMNKTTTKCRDIIPKLALKCSSSLSHVCQLRDGVGGASFRDINDG